MSQVSRDVPVRPTQRGRICNRLDDPEPSEGRANLPVLHSISLKCGSDIDSLWRLPRVHQTTRSILKILEMEQICHDPIEMLPDQCTHAPVDSNVARHRLRSEVSNSFLALDLHALSGDATAMVRRHSHPDCQSITSFWCPTRIFVST